MHKTRLENDILDAIATYFSIPRMILQIDNAMVVKREHTGSGICTHFGVPVSVPTIPDDELPKNPLPGPQISSPKLEAGGGCLLWVAGGAISRLEIYAHGDVFPEQLTAFTLSKECG